MNQSLSRTDRDKLTPLVQKKLASFRFRAFETILWIYIALGVLQFVVIASFGLWGELKYQELGVTTVVTSLTIWLYTLRHTKIQLAKSIFLVLFGMTQLTSVLTFQPLLALIWVAAVGGFLCLVFALLETPQRALRYSLLFSFAITIAYCYRVWFEAASFAPFNRNMLLVLGVAAFLFTGMLAAMTRWLGSGFAEALYLSQEMAQELRETNTKLVEARDAATAASKAKSQFMANMSHELRTPLNAIIGYTELVQDELKDAQPTAHQLVRGDLNKISGSGQQLLQLIEDILDIEKIESGRMDLHPEDINLEQIIQQLHQSFGPQFTQKKNQFTAEFSQPANGFQSSPQALRQILVNLLDNANKFTEAGSIALQIHPDNSTDLKRICIQVQDTGIGIEPNRLESIFEAFEQADMSHTRAFGGIGLGLTITSRLVQLLGGHIKVSSTIHMGSTFTVYLPLHSPLAIETKEESSTELSAD